MRLVLGWLAWRMLGPSVPPRFPYPQQRPIRLPGRSVLIGERELFIREAGARDGPVVVLVHGWGASSLLNFFRLIPLLVDHVRVVAVDQRNDGRSDRMREGYSIEGAADDVAGVLDRLGVGQATVVGYSMGGMVAQMLALRHPTRVAGLVLGATAAWVPARARWTRRLLLWALRGAERLSGTEGALFRHRYLIRSGAVEERYSRWLWETFMDRDPTLFYDAGFAALHFDGRPWLHKLGQPALVLITADDPLVPPEAQWELAELLEGSRVVELEGAGHEASLTHADQIAKAILGFLTDLDRPAEDQDAS